jgi:hypothetical protein
MDLWEFSNANRHLISSNVPLYGVIVFWLGPKIKTLPFKSDRAGRSAINHFVVQNMLPWSCCLRTSVPLLLPSSMNAYVWYDYLKAIYASIAFTQGRCHLHIDLLLFLKKNDEYDLNITSAAPLLPLWISLPQRHRFFMTVDPFLHLSLTFTSRNYNCWRGLIMVRDFERFVVPVTVVEMINGLAMDNGSGCRQMET